MKTNIADNLRERSRFADHDALLLKLVERYPSPNGNGVAFDFAFRDDPSLRVKLGIETARDLGACRQHVYGLTRKAAKGGNNGARQTTLTAPAPAAHGPGRPPSRFRQHEALLRKLLVRYPSPGGCISFDRAFHAEPNLRATLGITNAAEMARLRNHVSRMVKREHDRSSTDTSTTAMIPTTQVSAPELVQPEKRKYTRKVQTPASSHRFCPVCGTDQLPIAAAVAMQQH